MMHHWLKRFAVFRYAFGGDFVVAEIVAHAIPRKNFRRHEPRANIAAVVTEDEFIKPRFAPGPIFLRRHQDRLA